MIQCHNITKTYVTGGVETTVLKNVSFEIARGEFVAVMGPSGSGKSTLMHIMGCLDTPTSGTLLLDRRNISNLSEHELAEVRNQKIGFVFQAFNLLPRATVVRNVVLPLVYSAGTRQERAEAVRRALHAAAFPEEYWRHRSNQLSGGMMQRVAIARALVNNPAIILADEPTGNLDTKTGDAVLAAFEALHEQGRTIILITHEPLVAEHAERIIHIKDGGIISDEKNHHRRSAGRA